MFALLKDFVFKFDSADIPSRYHRDGIHKLMFSGCTKRGSSDKLLTITIAFIVQRSRVNQIYSRISHRSYFRCRVNTNKENIMYEFFRTCVFLLHIICNFILYMCIHI